jgi:chemotaxis protein MotB
VLEELDQLLRSREDLTKAKEELEKKLKGELESGDLSLSMQDRGLVVTVLDRVLFDSGKAELKETSEQTLNKVGDILGGKVGKHMVYVEGHTDNVPIRVSGWRSNWELSTARATEVIHFFVDQQGLDPRRLAATGYGEFHPVSGNESAEGRLKNRRVEIVISPKKMVTGGNMAAA